MILSNKCSINQSVGIIKKGESFALPPFLIYKVLLLHLRHHLTHLAACDHLHHLARLVELFQQTVYFLNSGTVPLAVYVGSNSSSKVKVARISCFSFWLSDSNSSP